MIDQLVISGSLLETNACTLPIWNGLSGTSIAILIMELSESVIMHTGSTSYIQK